LHRRRKAGPIAGIAPDLGLNSGGFELLQGVFISLPLRKAD
jgi:hypothetical protein